MLGTLSQHCMEAKICDSFTNQVTVYKFGIPKGIGVLAKEVLYPFAVRFNLVYKFLLVAKGCQRMILSLRDEFNTSRRSKLPETVNHFRDVLCKLVKGCSGY